MTMGKFREVLLVGLVWSAFDVLKVDSSHADHVERWREDWQIHHVQLTALENLYFAIGMNNTVAASNSSLDWFQHSDAPISLNRYCSFTGVSCDHDGYVMTLDLENYDLRGTLPEAIGDLEIRTH